MKSGKVDIRIYAGTVTRCHLRCVDEAGAYHPLDGTLTGQFRLFGVKHDIAVSFDAANERYVLEFDAQSFSPCYGVFELQLVNADSVQLMISGSLECLETLGNVNNGAEYQAQLVDGDKLVMTVIDGAKGDKGEQGERGVQGIQGEKGEKGDQGLQGIQGLKGEKGEKGDQGLQGIQGLKGDKGDTGAQGLPSDVMANANNNWTGTNTFQAPITLNNASVLAPNATTSLTGVATAANMVSFYCTLWGQTAPVRDITNVSNAADTQVFTALDKGVTPFNITGSVGSVFVSNSACAVGVNGFLIESAGGFYNVKHATISAMTTPLTLTIGATVYSKPTAGTINVPLVLRQNMFGVYFNGTETQSPQVATGAWLNLWFRKVTAGTLYIYVGNTNAI